MSDFQTYVEKIEDILGARFTDEGVLDLKISYDAENPKGLKNCVADIRLKQKALRMVKRDINRAIQSIQHEYQNKQALVGKGWRAIFATMFVGARAVGRYNTLNRVDIRTEKASEIEPYTRLKDAVDQLLYQLDRVKHNAELARK
jgi:hypothetical protein